MRKLKKRLIGQIAGWNMAKSLVNTRGLAVSNV